MHGNHGLGPGRNEAFQLLLVQIQRVGPDVGKNYPGAAQRKGICRGHEGEGGDNHFVAGLDIEQQGAHLERVRAGGGYHHLGHAQHLFQKCMAPFRVSLVPGNLADGHGLENVLQFPAHERGLVEGDWIDFGPFDLVGLT